MFNFILKYSLWAGEMLAAGTRDGTEGRWAMTPLQCVGEVNYLVTK